MVGSMKTCVIMQPVQAGGVGWAHNFIIFPVHQLKIRSLRLKSFKIEVYSERILWHRPKRLLDQ